MALPYIKFYPGDFQRDTRDLTFDERAAYWELLQHQWVKGSVPDDDGKLATILRIDIRRWRRMRKAVLGYFDLVEGRWVQPRMARDRDEATRSLTIRRESGSLGGKAKALKAKQKPIASAIAKTYQTDVDVTTDSPTGTESDKDSPNYCSYDHEFAQIMAIYPRKTHRQEGRMAFYEARKVATFREIVAGIDRLKANLPDDLRYVPALPKWLLGERWKDEPLPARQERETPYQAAIRKAKADINEAVYGKRDDSERSNVIDLQAHSSA